MAYYIMESIYIVGYCMWREREEDTRMMITMVAADEVRGRRKMIPARKFLMRLMYINTYRRLMHIKE